MSTFSDGPTRVFDIHKTISTKVSGIDVEGVMIGCSWDVDVEITKPYSNLSTGSHIPVLARGLPRSFKGEFGEVRAREMLEYLYLIGKHIKQNKEILRKKLVEHRLQLAGTSEEIHWELEDAFFEANFPMLISLGTRQSVFDILDGGKELSTLSRTYDSSTSQGRSRPPADIQKRHSPFYSVS